MIPFYIFRILFPLVTKSSSTHEWLELQALTLSKKANSFRVPYRPASANEMSFKVPVLCFWKKNLPITSSFLNPIHINTLCIQNTHKKKLMLIVHATHLTAHLWPFNSAHLLGWLGPTRGASVLVPALAHLALVAQGGLFDSGWVVIPDPQGTVTLQHVQLEKK